MQGKFEPLQPLFVSPDFDAAAGKIFGERVYRVEVAGMRHYLRESGRLYRSLTTFLEYGMPKNKFLETWREEMTADLGSVEKMDEWMQNVADYGTALHIASADYSRNNGVNWQDFESWAFEYLMAMDLKDRTLQSALSQLIKDFASLVQFFHDYRVRVIAVELPVFMEAGVATLIDLVVEMDAKNYDKTPEDKRQRVIAAINIKSGKNFFEEHQFQLVGERRAFNETFGQTVGYKIELVFNLAPQAWREKPTYKLKDQTDEIEKNRLERRFDLYLEDCEIRGILTEPTRKFPIFWGETPYGGNPQDVLRILTYNEFSTTRIQKLREETSQ